MFGVEKVYNLGDEVNKIWVVDKSDKDTGL